MRHVWSLLAGVVAAPLTWLFLSTGQYRSQATVAGWDQAGRFDTSDLIGPVAFLVVAGILLGVLGTMRWSPAGPLAAGVLFIIPTILMFANPFDTLERFLRPDDGGARRVLGQDLQPWLPVENGTLLVLGVLLLMATFSVQRWRRWPTMPSPAPLASDADVVAGISALGSQQASEQPSTPATMSDDEILAAAAAFKDQGGEPSTEPARTWGQEETRDNEGTKRDY